MWWLVCSCEYFECPTQSVIATRLNNIWFYTKDGNTPTTLAMQHVEGKYTKNSDDKTLWRNLSRSYYNRLSFRAGQRCMFDLNCEISNGYIKYSSDWYNDNDKWVPLSAIKFNLSMMKALLEHKSADAKSTVRVMKTVMLRLVAGSCSSLSS